MHWLRFVYYAIWAVALVCWLLDLTDAVLGTHLIYDEVLARMMYLTLLTFTMYMVTRTRGQIFDVPRR